MVFRCHNGRDVLFSSFDPGVCTMLARKQSVYPVFFLTDAGGTLYADPRKNSLRQAIQFAKVGREPAAFPCFASGAASVLTRALTRALALLCTVPIWLCCVRRPAGCPPVRHRVASGAAGGVPSPHYGSAVCRPRAVHLRQGQQRRERVLAPEAVRGGGRHRGPCHAHLEAHAR